MSTTNIRPSIERPDVSAIRDKVLKSVGLVDLDGRERALALLDQDSDRELVGPFDHLESPWLTMQGIVPQADDGIIVMRGRLAGHEVVVLSLASKFQGGSIGEVSGAKIAATLDLVLADCEKDKPIVPILILETGGVRLQEANLGLAVIAEIHSAMIALRAHVPVITLITGTVGCFGGMSIAAALSSDVFMLPTARLGLNGPEVIEQEAGIAELNAHDKATIWHMIGGKQRAAMGLVKLLDNDVHAVAAALQAVIERGPNKAPLPCENIEATLELLSKVKDPTQRLTPENIVELCTNQAQKGAKL